MSNSTRVSLQTTSTSGLEGMPRTIRLPLALDGNVGRVRRDGERTEERRVQHGAWVEAP